LEVPCEIVHIDRTRQAEAFAAINGNTTKVTPQIVYYARLTGRDPGAEQMARVLAAAGVTVCRANRTLRDMKQGETGAVGALFKFLKKFGPETLSRPFNASPKRAQETRDFCEQPSSNRCASYSIAILNGGIPASAC
jgi:hypothetical protein